MSKGIKIPWWVPDAYEDAKKEGFEGDISTFVFDLLFDGLIERYKKLNKARRDRNSLWNRLKRRYNA